jgi:hypothetical protein
VNSSPSAIGVSDFIALAVSPSVDLRQLFILVMTSRIGGSTL